MQWKLYRALFQAHLEPVFGPFKGNASDGDSRRRKVQLNQSQDLSGHRFQPIPKEEGFLFSAAVREDGVVTNLSDQDYIHNHKKLDRHLDHQGRMLYIGHYPLHRNFLRQVLQQFSVHEHGLRVEDVNKKDVMNWASCQRTVFPKVRDCLWKLVQSN